MGKFTEFTEAKKGKGKRESIPTTATSSPLRGANQDYSGVGVTHDHADYTISDGFIAGTGKVRATPVNIKTSGHTGTSNAPTNAHAMQHAADARRAQLDKIAQKQRDMQKRDREMQVKQREKDLQKEANNPLTGLAQKIATKSSIKDPDKDEDKKEMKKFKLFREDFHSGGVQHASFTKKSGKRTTADSSHAPAKVHVKEEEIVEDDLDEARRGRPRKGEGEDQESSNIIMQLRKVISLRGQAPIRFLDGKQSMMSPATAHRLLSMYDNLKTTGEKHSFANRIHKSAESLRDVMAGKKEVVKPKITLAGKQH